jgi:hypothetical protein
LDLLHACTSTPSNGANGSDLLLGPGVALMGRRPVGIGLLLLVEMWHALNNDCILSTGKLVLSQVLSEVCDLVLIKYNANNLITNGASSMVKKH